MRRTLPLLLLVLVGCGEKPAPTVTKPVLAPQLGSPSEVPKDWKKHTAPQFGLSFSLPPSWQVENEVNGKIEVKQDPEAQKAAAQQFDKIRVALSAVDGKVDPKAQEMPTTFALIVTTPKIKPASAEALLKESLEDAQVSFPKGHPNGAMIEVPAGKAARVSYEDSGSMGLSSSPSAQPKVIETVSIQYRLLGKKDVYLLNLTGPREKQKEIETIASQIVFSFAPPK